MSKRGHAARQTCESLDLCTFTVVEVDAEQMLKFPLMSDLMCVAA